MRPDHAPFDEYVIARGPALLRLAYLLTGERHLAEDVVQSALARAYPRWGRITTTEQPDAYMRRIVVNTYASWRRLRRSDEIPGGVLERPAPDEVAARDERDVMWRVLADLPPRQRAVLVLRYYEDLTDVQIAEVLECALGTVRGYAARAFATLRRHPSLCDFRIPCSEEE